MPWTPKLLETFQKEKGYDLKPYIAQFFANELTPERNASRRTTGTCGAACFATISSSPRKTGARRGTWNMVHLNHEEQMTALVKNEGSFFRDMRYVGLPGIDNLNQIRPGIVADFPRSHRPPRTYSAGP